MALPRRPRHDFFWAAERDLTISLFRSARTSFYTFPSVLEAWSLALPRIRNWIFAAIFLSS